MQGSLIKFHILFHCLLDGGQFICSEQCPFAGIVGVQSQPKGELRLLEEIVLTQGCVRDIPDSGDNGANEGFIFLQIFCLLAFAPVFGIWVSLRILNPVRKRCEGQLLRDELIPIRTFG